MENISKTTNLLVFPNKDKFVHAELPPNNFFYKSSRTL